MTGEGGTAKKEQAQSHHSAVFSRSDGAKSAPDRQNQAAVAAKNTGKTLLLNLLGADAWTARKMGKTSIGPPLLPAGKNQRVHPCLMTKTIFPARNVPGTRRLQPAKLSLVSRSQLDRVVPLLVCGFIFWRRLSEWASISLSSTRSMNPSALVFESCRCSKEESPHFPIPATSPSLMARLLPSFHFVRSTHAHRRATIPSYKAACGSPLFIGVLISWMDRSTLQLECDDPRAARDRISNLRAHMFSRSFPLNLQFDLYALKAPCIR